jgi:ferrous iron transport protein A
MLQLSGNTETLAATPSMPSTKAHSRVQTLADLRKGDAAILDRIDLPAEIERRLMELGFVPGTRIVAGCCAPGGDPRVFQVDGSEIALRRETAAKLPAHLEHPKDK